MTFEDIRGQEGPRTILKRLLDSSGRGQSLLFEGPSGTGKRLTALVTAAAHLCQSSSGNLPCGSCQACRNMHLGGHEGFWLIDPELSEGDLAPEQPDGDGNISAYEEPDEEPDRDQIDRSHVEPDRVEGFRPGLLPDETGPGRIGIDPVRALRERLSLKPSGNPRRALVLADFDLATLEAQNALLKTLEEPPARMLIICTAESTRGMPPTIVSRCQRIRFHPLSIEDTSEILRSETDLSKEDRDFLARISDGRPGRALQIAEQNLLEEREWLQDHIESSGSPAHPSFRNALLERITASSGPVNQRDRLRQHLLLIKGFLREALQERFDSGGVRAGNQLFSDRALRTYLEHRETREILEGARVVRQIDDAIDRYVNVKVLVENLRF